MDEIALADRSGGSRGRRRRALRLQSPRSAGPLVTAPVTRGDILDVVGATGSLQAVTTVQVGSQVSGTIQRLHADFNSVVRKGQVIARLDPSSFEARVGQAHANLLAARANVERARANVEDAGAAAELKASEAAVRQAQAALEQARVDLEHTAIQAPIDGVVIARSVEVGQTVAASLQAPVLFVIANDLSRMQVNASVDEADVGRVRAGQQVTFRVDAFPERSFEGRDAGRSATVFVPAPPDSPSPCASAPGSPTGSSSRGARASRRAIS